MKRKTSPALAIHQVALRLTEEEWKLLRKQAGLVSLARHIRSILFGVEHERKKRGLGKP